MKLIVFLCLIALLFTIASAHRGVRVKKPETEEARLEHHLLHRRRPRKQLKNDYSIDGDEGKPKFHKSKSYHFKVGPRVPRSLASP